MVFPALKTFFFVIMYMLLFNFILGLILIFPLFYVFIPKNKGKNIKPRTKLNHNMYILFSNNNNSIRLTWNPDLNVLWLFWNRSLSVLYFYIYVRTGRWQVLYFPNKAPQIKMESIRKLRTILIFSGKKTLHQNILGHIAFFFTLFKGYRCN